MVLDNVNIGYSVYVREWMFRRELNAGREYGIIKGGVLI